MNKRFLLFFAFCSFSAMSIASEETFECTGYQRIASMLIGPFLPSKEELDGLFEKNGLKDFNEFTNISTKIKSKKRDDDQILAAIYLSITTYSNHLNRGPIRSDVPLAPLEEMNIRQRAQNEFKERRKSIYEIIFSGFPEQKSQINFRSPFF